MKKLILDNAKIKKIRIATLTLAFVVLVFYFFSIQSYKGEGVIGTYPSPNGTYILTTYLNNAKDWTVDFAVLGRVKNTKTNLSKNVYYKYHCNVAEVQWLDDTTVVINDVIINVKKDIYDNSDYDPRYLEFSRNK